MSTLEIYIAIAIPNQEGIAQTLETEEKLFVQIQAPPHAVNDLKKYLYDAVNNFESKFCKEVN